MVDSQSRKHFLTARPLRKWPVLYLFDKQTIPYTNMASKEQRTRPQALYIWRLKHSRLRAEFHDRVAKSIANGLDPGWLVDVGCGPGLLAKKLLARSPELRVVGLDIDIAMLNEARSNGCAYLIRASADSIPLRTDAVGRVVSTTSLKDWANRAKGLAEIGRVIRRGGTAFVYDFITVGPESRPPHFVRRFGIVSEILRRAVGLVRPFSLQDALDLAETIAVTRSIQVEVNLERDLGIVRVVMRKSPHEKDAAEARLLRGGQVSGRQDSGNPL